VTTAQFFSFLTLLVQCAYYLGEAVIALTFIYVSTVLSIRHVLAFLSKDR
jgi:hypothetical protein